MNAGRAKRKGEIRWPLLNELARIKPGEYCIRPTPPQPLKPSRPRMTSRPVDVNATSLYTPTVPGPRRLAAPLQRQTVAVSYTHLRAHETPEHLVCRLLL